MYQEVPETEPLGQGDIIDGCPLLRLPVPVEGVDLAIEPRRWDTRVIVLTQACDLAHTKATKILVAMIQPAQTLVDQGVLKPTTIRDQVRRGSVYGWYFLPAAASPISLAESIIDLREIHTIHRAILDNLISSGKRVCRLMPPFREHLAQHFAVTYMRIGLPTPYDTEP